MIRFLYQQQTITLDAERADLTLLQWLREHQRKTGTKEGCASGDCGACTVVLASVESINGKPTLNYESANSCILFAGALHGKQLITVEDLASGDDLHPVQQAMIDCHGAQCGFCTPGFIMSLFALYHSQELPTNTDKHQRHKLIERYLGGNLCRCTGYAPIVRAAEQALSNPEPDKFDAAESETVEQLQELIRKQPMHPSFIIPTSLAELATMKVQYPVAPLLAGGTDLSLQVTQELKEFESIIYVKNVPELLDVSISHEGIRMGAAVSLNRCMSVLRKAVPQSESMMLRFGSEQVRNQGTIGGNIANASPIGDLPPLLLALNASVELQQGTDVRRVKLDDFFHSYKETALQPNEFLSAILIPAMDPELQVLVYKVSKRFDDDISAVCGVFCIALQSDKVASVRIAFGGMAAVPKRAISTENSLIGQVFNEATVAKAVDALESDFQPISDARASASYRQQIAGNLLKRCFLQLTVPEASLQVSDYVGR